MDRKQIEVNYLYFGGFLALLWITGASAIFMKESLAGSRPFFFLYAAGQSLFETLLFVFLGSMIKAFLGRSAAVAFVGLSFLFLVLHLLDFLMDRILDLSIWETIGFVTDESWSNFLYLLDASGIPLWIWICAFLLIGAIPFIGIALHSWTGRIASNRPLFLRKDWVFQAFFCIPAALLFWEFSASPILHPDSYTSFVQSLPWKCTFLQPKIVQYSLPATLASPKTEEQIKLALEKLPVDIGDKPNIYLFVIESFREDFIRPEIAPHLHRFKNEANHFELALSNANGSHPSWFSIFHSQFSCFWQSAQQAGWSLGSPPIQALKKWGYQVRLYTSAQLKYYGMDELLFGQDLHLVDSLQAFPHTPPISAAQSDRQTVQAWARDLEQDPSLAQGQLVIFFWDSTHFNYSWPSDWAPKFTPISNDIDYFDIFQSQNKIDKIKNRYRNSVNYVDSLFGDFLNTVPDQEKAIVVVTGDHGEEFFEHGHLFHGSHITHEQTNIPLYMKFGTKKAEVLPRVVTQMDIFPTILHYVGGKTVPFLEGRSIFSSDVWPYAVISRFNAGRSPYEFCIHNGDTKVIARFDNKKNIFLSKSLLIRSLRDIRDQCLYDCKKHEIENRVETEFGPAIKRLFQ